MSSNSKQRIEAVKMLKFLKKEEAYYERTLHNMKQELQRLNVEEFSIRAGIRQEQLKLYHQNGVVSSTNNNENPNEDENSANDSVASSSRRSKKIHLDENTSSSSSSHQGDDHSQKCMIQDDHSQKCMIQDDHSQKCMIQDDHSQTSMSQDDLSQNSISQPSPAANDSVMSNISDERYLEPLILNPRHQYHDDAFVEFDD